MKQTVNKAVDNHRKFWHGVADDIKERGLWTDDSTVIKKDVMHRLFPENKEEIRDNCFLCEFVVQETGNDVRDCNKCPMLREASRLCLYGLYTRFSNACYNGAVEAAITTAQDIAEMPVENPLYLRKDG